jgi:hypothetical protein
MMTVAPIPRPIGEGGVSTISRAAGRKASSWSWRRPCLSGNVTPPVEDFAGSVRASNGSSRTARMTSWCVPAGATQCCIACRRGSMKSCDARRKAPLDQIAQFCAL